MYVNPGVGCASGTYNAITGWSDRTACPLADTVLMTSLAQSTTATSADAFLCQKRFRRNVTMTLAPRVSTNEALLPTGGAAAGCRAPPAWCRTAAVKAQSPDIASLFTITPSNAGLSALVSELKPAELT